MQNNTNQSFFAKAADPMIQAAIVLVGIVIFTFLTKVAIWTGAAEFKEYIPWVISASFLLFYAVFNSVFSLSADDVNQYWIRSMTSYAILAILAAGVSYLASSISFNEAGTIKWIFIVLTFVYLVFLSIVNFMKKIVNFAEREEWQAPKKRSKKR